MKKFRRYDPEQVHLLPQDPRTWLPEDHLVFFLDDVVDKLDLSAITQPYEAEERGYPPYQDVMPYVLGSMDLVEVLAEKIRTLATRSKARDLFDVAQLARAGIGVDPAIVGRKMEWAGLAFDPAGILEGARNVKGVWERELQSLMEGVQPFDEAYSALARLLGDPGAPREPTG